MIGVFAFCQFDFFVQFLNFFDLFKKLKRFEIVTFLIENGIDVAHIGEELLIEATAV